MRKKIWIILILFFVLLLLTFYFINYSVIKDLFSNSIDINNFKSLTKNDFKFMGITPDQELNHSSQEIIKFLGKPIEIKENNDIENGIITWMYIYNSFEVNTVRYASENNKDIEHVDYIKIFKRGATTTRGITVGDPESLIQIKYGPFERYNDKCYIFRKDSYKIFYYIKDSKIDRIYICLFNVVYFDN
jgi:hypothetical protein